jgi:hypothetical protein
MNQVRYYSRYDERGVLRLLRQVDGGASVLMGRLGSVTFSYWDAQGHKTAQADLVRRVIIEIAPSHRAAKEKREIGLRS